MAQARIGRCANHAPVTAAALRLSWEIIMLWYDSKMAHTERQVVVGARGRLVLPSAVRAELGIKPGTRLLLSTEPDGSLRLRPYRAVAEQGRGLLAQLEPADRSMVDELLAERRREAARENGD
jgi:AbrB family looped-hinge helix DNA binding protein